MRKCWYPAFFPFFTMFSTPLKDQSHSLIHILFVLCRRFRLMSLKFYCLVIHISHKTEIGCAWSKCSGERLKGHYGALAEMYPKSRQKLHCIAPIIVWLFRVLKIRKFEHEYQSRALDNFLNSIV